MIRGDAEGKKMNFWCTPKSIFQYGFQKNAGHKNLFYIVYCPTAAFGCAPKRSQSPPQSIDLWKKFGTKKTQKCNLYCNIENWHHRLRTKAKPESTAKYTSLKNVWAKKNQKTALPPNNENIPEWYSLLLTHVHLSNCYPAPPVLGMYYVLCTMYYVLYMIYYTLLCV